MLDTLRADRASGRIATPATRERVTAAIGAIGVIGAILAEAARTGSLREDADPGDVTAMLFGVFPSTAAGGAPQQTGRLLDLVLDALRPRTAAMPEVGPARPAEPGDALGEPR